jgi:uncharacterized protein (TIGR03437 family)
MSPKSSISHLPAVSRATAITFRLLPVALTFFTATAVLFAQQTPTPNSWSLGTPMPTPRSGPFTAAVGGKIYVIGGENNNAALNVNEIYNPATNSWSTGAPMPTARWVGGTAVVNNIIYCIAGSSTNAAFTNVEAYDPSTNTWSTKAPIPMFMNSVYAVTINNIIYMVGGFNAAAGGRLKTLFSYNPATDTWSSLASMAVGKSQSALGVFGQTIVAAGGLLESSNATTDNEGYNVITNTWTALAPLPTPRHAGCFESDGDMLFFAGGHSVGNGSPLATMDAYNAATNTWMTGLATLPHAVVNSGSATVGGVLYCFGGSNAGDPQQGTMFNYTQIYQPPNLLPVISSGGIVSASAFGGFSSFSPGSWIEIYGNNLASDTRGWGSSDFNGINAPTSLDQTTITIGGKSAFVDYISAGQVNALVSSDTPTGMQQLVVQTSVGSSAAYNVTVNPTQPGLLAPSSFRISGVPYVVAILSDGSYALPTGAVSGVASRPAHPGETVTMYGVGFGPVTPNTPAGQLAQQLTMLPPSFTMSIGGTPVALAYAGLAPNFTGLYQFNVTIPSVPSGNAPVTFSLNGTGSVQTLYIAVQD